MSQREIDYLKKLNKILENENIILKEKLTLSESVVETLFSHTKEREDCRLLRKITRFLLTRQRVIIGWRKEDVIIL